MRPPPAWGRGPYGVVVCGNPWGGITVHSAVELIVWFVDSECRRWPAPGAVFGAD